jgi:hypothetical protein
MKGDLSEEEHRAFAAKMYARWQGGEFKSHLKSITALWTEHDLSSPFDKTI